MQIFSQIPKLQVPAYAIHAKLSDKEGFSHKIALNRGFRFDRDSLYVNNMEISFFPKQIEARRKLSLVGLISKHHYHPQILQFDLRDNPRWQANKKAKHGRFHLDRYRTFAFQHESMVYNPGDQEWTPNAIDNPWANCPDRNPQHENHVIHALGWSLQLTNITLTFDVKSESIYYGKISIKCDLERGYCPPNHAIKATNTWQPKNHCRFFDVGRSYARMIKLLKR